MGYQLGGGSHPNYPRRVETKVGTMIETMDEEIGEIEVTIREIMKLKKIGTFHIRIIPN